jgi:uncharacterized membrane protein YdjX (TVP38/TMEM64 family)
MSPSFRRARRIALTVLAVLALASVSAIAWLGYGGGWRTVAATVAALGAKVEANRPLAIAAFFVIAFVAQLIVMPSGTVIVLIGGFLLGAWPAALGYYVAQLAAAPVVYGAARAGFGRMAQDRLEALVRAVLPGRFASLLNLAQSEGVLAVIALRLAPVLTSAMVPLIAAAAGIRLGRLMLGSLLISWIKPTFFAGIGAAARNLAEVTEPAGLLDKISLAPILVAFGAALLLFAARVALGLRRGE